MMKGVRVFSLLFLIICAVAVAQRQTPKVCWHSNGKTPIGNWFGFCPTATQTPFTCLDCLEKGDAPCSTPSSDAAKAFFCMPGGCASGSASIAHLPECAAKSCQQCLTFDGYKWCIRRNLPGGRCESQQDCDENELEMSNPDYCDKDPYASCEGCIKATAKSSRKRIWCALDGKPGLCRPDCNSQQSSELPITTVDLCDKNPHDSCRNCVDVSHSQVGKPLVWCINHEHNVNSCQLRLYCHREEHLVDDRNKCPETTCRECLTLDGYKWCIKRGVPGGRCESQRDCTDDELEMTSPDYCDKDPYASCEGCIKATAKSNRKRLWCDRRDQPGLCRPDCNLQQFSEIPIETVDLCNKKPHDSCRDCVDVSHSEVGKPLVWCNDSENNSQSCQLRLYCPREEYVVDDRNKCPEKLRN